MSRVFCAFFLIFCLIASAQDYEVTVTTVSVWVRTTDKSGKPGGVYFGNSLNFKRGFDAILDDLNHQYLICYKPPEHKKEDPSIEVKVKQPGVKIRYREGYYEII